MAKARGITEVEGTSIADVRAAVTANCGGWNGASDEAIATKWRSLSEKLRGEYLKKVKKPEALKPAKTMPAPPETNKGGDE